MSVVLIKNDDDDDDDDHMSVTVYISSVFSRCGCIEKAVRLLLSPVNMTNSSDVTVRLLPWLIATSQQDLSLMRMIVESESVRSQPLFRCLDEGTSHLLITFTCDYSLLC